MGEPGRKWNGSPWRRWHRRLGLVSAFFVLVLALTGLLLNHTAGLGLGKHRVNAGWLLALYGVDTPARPVSYAAGGQWVSWLEGRVYWGAVPVLDNVDALRGAIKAGPVIAVALVDEVALFTKGGRLVERMGRSARVPAGIQRLGVSADGALVLSADSGYYRGDPELTGFVPVRRPEAVRWSRPTPMPAALHQQLLAAWRGPGPNLERVLLDLHSGRILGTWGVWLVDAMALIFAVLALSGIWLWWRRRGQTRASGDRC